MPIFSGFAACGRFHNVTLQPHQGSERNVLTVLCLQNSQIDLPNPSLPTWNTHKWYLHGRRSPQLSTDEGERKEERKMETQNFKGQRVGKG